MAVEFDLYVRRSTWLHRLDPRVKLAFVLEATLLPFLVPTLWTSAALVLVCLVLIWRARAPVRYLVRIGRIMAPLLMMVFLLTALFGGGGEPLWASGPIAVTSESLHQGVFLSVRLLALALIVFVWLLTTDQASMVQGFLALRLPYEWGLILALALRYLPVFAGLFEQVRDAQQARGLDLERGGFFYRLQAYRPVLIALVISALRNSERLGWALEARAVGATNVRRTTLRPLRLRRADWVAFGVLGIGLVFSMLIRFR